MPLILAAALAAAYFTVNATVHLLHEFGQLPAWAGGFIVGAATLGGVAWLIGWAEDRFGVKLIDRSGRPF